MSTAWNTTHIMNRIAIHAMPFAVAFVAYTAFSDQNWIGFTARIALTVACQIVTLRAYKHGEVEGWEKVIVVIGHAIVWFYALAFLVGIIIGIIESVK